jgi:hypothetical protein
VQKSSSNQTEKSESVQVGRSTQLQGASMPTRFLPRFFVVLSLLAISLGSSSVRANEYMAGKFKLAHPTRWNDVVLPAGEYSFRLTRVQGQNAQLLTIRLADQKINFFLHGQRACENCHQPALNLTVQGQRYEVSSIDVPGLHADFDVHTPSGAKEEESARAPKSSEQVAVQFDQN